MASESKLSIDGALILLESYAKNGLLGSPDVERQLSEMGLYKDSNGQWRPGLAAYTSADLSKAQLKPIEFIIPGILPPGLTILAAPPKTGKSWLVLDICTAVATGGRFWGRECQKGTVLYLDLEGSQNRLKSRLTAMCADSTADMHITHQAQNFDFGLIDQIKDFCDRRNPVLIVIDTLGRIKGGSRHGENAYETDSRIYGALQAFAIEKGIAIIGVTHMRKTQAGSRVDDPYERVMGSTGLTGVADTIWLLQRKRDSSEGTLHVSGREIEEWVELSIELNRNPSGWRLIGTAEEVAAQRAEDEYLTSPIRKLIKKHIESDNLWCGTARDLFECTAVEVGEYPATSPIETGRLINKWRNKLLEKDGITYTHNTKTRQYIFQRAVKRMTDI